ncbi:MAG: phytanoyl-CoA dioxygenase family protein [Candidatus Dormibacteria bacterium]
MIQTAPASVDPLADYNRDGFAILRGAFSREEVEELRADALRICRGEGETVVDGLSPASPGDSDDDVMRRYLCIHFPHKVSAIARRSLAHPSIVGALTSLIGPNVKCMQSMLFIKASGKPGQAWHQDEYFIPTRDRSLTAAWVALDDATQENGCMWMIPGSHKRGVLWPQHQHQDGRFDCTGEAYSFPYTEADEVCCDVRAGDVVIFNGYVLHRSLPNTVPGSYRRALTFHYMSAESLLPWMPRDGHGAPDLSGDRSGTLQGVLDYRDVVLVAGEDPYAYLGLEDRSRPHLRPSGEGGCGTPERNVSTS